MAHLTTTKGHGWLEVMLEGLPIDYRSDVC